jgi:vitamin B12 transporter
LGVSQENSAGYNTVASNNPSYKNYPHTASAYTREGITSQVSQEWLPEQEFGLKFFATRSSYQYPSSDPLTYRTPEMDQQVGDLYVTSLYTKNRLTKDWVSLLQVSNSTNNSQNITSQTNNPINTPQNIATWQNDIHFGDDILQLIAERRVQYVNATYSPLITGLSSETSVNTNRSTNSFAGSYQFKSGSNLLTAAARNDDISGYGSKATGSIAYGYFFTKEIRANVNYGTGFRAPTFNDLYYPGYGNTSLQPETNKNLEAGLHYETGIYDIHLVEYQNKIQNLIIPLPCASQLSGYCPTNFAKTQITGTSLGGNARLGNLTIKSSYDFTNAIDVASGLQLPNRAKNTANIGADYRLSKTDIGVNLTLSGVRYGNAANTQAMGGYGLMNLYLNHELDNQWSLFAKWNNVFNAQYQLAYGYLTPGSNIFVGVRYAGK